MINGKELLNRLYSGPVTVSKVQQPCHDYRIHATTDCPTSTPDVTVFFSGHFERMTSRTKSVVQETSVDEQIVISKVKKPVFKAIYIADEDLAQALHRIELHNTVTIEKLDGSFPPWTLERVAVRDLNNQNAYVLEMTFEVINSAEEFGICCASAYNNAPYEECDPVVGGGPTGPDGCNGFEVDIIFDGTTLQSVLSGGPTGDDPKFYFWYKDSVLISTAEDITEAGPGLYELVARHGLCEDNATLEIEDTCLGYTVGLQENSGVLVASATRTSTFSWFKNDGAGGEIDLSHSGSSYIPTESGTFIVKGVSGGCNAQSSIAFSHASCPLTVSISRDGSELTAMVSNESGVITYSWWKDIGAGLIDTGETGNTFTITESGYYELRVTDDNCVKSAQITVFDQCINFKGWIERVIDQAGLFQITAEWINAPDDVTVTWYQNLGAGWFSLGIGQTISVGTKSGVRAVISSGTCKRTDELYFTADPDKITPFQKFNVTDIDEDLIVQAFTFANPASSGNNEIDDRYEVFRNGVRLSYFVDGRRGYSYDFATNKIVFTWPLKVGDIITVRELYS